MRRYITSGAKALSYLEAFTRPWRAALPRRRRGQWRRDRVLAAVQALEIAVGIGVRGVALLRLPVRCDIAE